MYIMYVDESGDIGLPPPIGASPTRYFCLSGIVIHELRWADTAAELLSFRHWLKRRYGVYLDDELHAAELISKVSSLPAALRSLRKYERLAILRHHADQLARLDAISIINVCVDKAAGKDSDSASVFRRGWYALFQRFENTMLRGNFPGPPNDQERGIVFADATDGRRIREYLERMRVRNPLRIRQSGGTKLLLDEPIRLVIEDPICRDSRDSYFVQAADCAAFLFKQHVDPSSYMKRVGGNAYLSTRLRPVLCTKASMNNPLGAVLI